VLTRILPLLGVMAALTGMAQACPHCHDEKDPVKVTLVVILASEEGDTIDPRLKAIAQEVQRRNPNLKSFTLKHMEIKSLKPGEKVSLPLVEKRKVDMVIKHGANKDNRVSLAIFVPNMGEIEYQTVCGKFLPIVTRCKTKAGERLILAIRVQPCRGD
jgi:hypothetical protein